MSHHPLVPDPRPAFIIISGGQTGADRAALDFAIVANIPHGGWCPKGRRAEDGVIPARYNLRETPSSNYLQRTEWNVRDSDATIIFTDLPRLTGGTKRTAQFATEHEKLYLIMHRGMDTKEVAAALAKWITKLRITRLNVAGSRASKAPSIVEFTTRVLTLTFANLNAASATTHAILPTTPSPPA